MFSFLKFYLLLECSPSVEQLPFNFLGSQILMILNITLKVSNWAAIYHSEYYNHCNIYTFDNFIFKKCKVYNKARMYFEVHHVL